MLRMIGHLKKDKELPVDCLMEVINRAIIRVLR